MGRQQRSAPSALSVGGFAMPAQGLTTQAGRVGSADAPRRQEYAIASGGMVAFARIDRAERDKSAGLELSPTEAAEIRVARP